MNAATKRAVIQRKKLAVDAQLLQRLQDWVFEHADAGPFDAGALRREAARLGLTDRVAAACDALAGPPAADRAAVLAAVRRVREALDRELAGGVEADRSGRRAAAPDPAGRRGSMDITEQPSSSSLPIGVPAKRLRKALSADRVLRQCEACGSSFPQFQSNPVLGCGWRCRRCDQQVVVARGTAKRTFCLSDEDLASLPSEPRLNPVNPGYAPLTLYRRPEVLAAALRVHGGAERLEAAQRERQRRTEARQRAREQWREEAEAYRRDPDRRVLRAASASSTAALEP